MAIGFSNKVYAHYFTEKKYKLSTEAADENDVVIKEINCSAYKEKGGLCDKCYNERLLEKMHKMPTNEKRLTFMNYQVNLYDNPLAWLKEAKDFLFEMDSSEGYLDYKEHDVYMQICVQGIAQLENKNKEKEAIESGSGGPKLVWRKNPELFFTLFSAMYEEGYFNIKSGNNDEKQVAEILYRTFQVNSKIGDRKEYSQSTFLQNFKSTSQLQSESQENIVLKNNILKFLKFFPDQS